MPAEWLQATAWFTGWASLVGLLIWIANRQIGNLDRLHTKVDEDVVPRLVRVETKLQNGQTDMVFQVKEQVDRIHQEFQEHAEGEENRLISAYRRMREEEALGR